MNAPLVFAIDFETTYTDTRDIKTLGSMAYLRHPETQAYLMSVVGPGLEWVGHPQDAPWSVLDGHTWVSHNRSFDRQVWMELKRRGLPASNPSAWHCTADMAACLQVKRDLATSSKVLLHVLLDKGVRNRMKNQTWETMTPEFRVEACDYAQDDSTACYHLWDGFSAQWPEQERLLSEHTSLMTDRGVAINLSLVQGDIAWLEPALALVLDHIPWWGEVDAKGKPIKAGSSKRLTQECERLGIPAPLSTDLKDERFGDWAEEWAETAPFVAAVQQWRQVTRLLGFARNCLLRTVDGRLRYGLKYCGSPHTRRWSGDLGLSVHNMPKGAYTAEELGSVLWPGKTPEERRRELIRRDVDPDGSCNPRKYLVPPDGKVFISSDLSQIEPRVLAYFSGQTGLLKLMREGLEVYEAQARSMGLYSGIGPLKDTDPDLRQTVKILNLGLGYGLGASGLIRSYRRTTGKRMDATRAETLVNMYRARNPEIAGKKGLWGHFSIALYIASRTDKHLSLELPSERSIEYWDVRNDREVGSIGTVERGAPPKKLWHGLLTENCVQGTARDALGTMILNLEKQLPVVLHVHDEVLTEVPADRAEEGLQFVRETMSQSPSWAPDLPVACDAKIMTRYEKK